VNEICPSCSNGHVYAPGVLHEYQELARDFLRGRDKSALFLDMGLGKTATALAALEPRHFPVLVVAPKRVAETVWDVEQEIWRPDLGVGAVARAMGSPAERARSLASGAPVTTIGRDNFKDVAALGKKAPWRTLIIDELSGYKGRGARWKQMRDYIRNTGIPHVWGLTGSPAPNGLLDLWPQIALLDNGARLGKNITAYRSRYFYPGRQLPNGTIIEWILRPEAKDHIYALIEDITLSMQSEGKIELPGLTWNKVPITMPPKSQKVYRKIAADLCVDMSEIFGSGEIHTAASAGVLTSKLSQILAGFLYVDDADIRQYQYQEMHLEKIEAVKSVIESEHEGGVLVFYRFRAELAMLQRHLKEWRTIDEPDVVQDWNRGEVPVLLAHPASAGHGLNLQHGGHTVVWTSLPWDFEQWDQANKRLARQGQRHPVVIHMLMGSHSIDHRILSTLDSKEEIQDDLLSYLESPI
jgi:SNF2 family DNA or RNA helicase